MMTNPLPDLSKITKLTTQLFSESMSLEMLMDELCKYGYPRLFNDENGWHCRIDIKISSQGVSFKIMSHYDHNTHIEAATLCLQRMIKALEDIHKG